jgi:ketol-acid reductoisomerase
MKTEFEVVKNRVQESFAYRDICPNSKILVDVLYPCNIAPMMGHLSHHDNIYLTTSPSLPIIPSTGAEQTQNKGSNNNSLYAKKG